LPSQITLRTWSPELFLESDLPRVCFSVTERFHHAANREAKPKFECLIRSLTIFNSQTPLDRCLATNQASACLIPVSCRSNPSRDNESSDDKRSINQNGYENFVQKTAELLSGYTSRRKNREARGVPAFIPLMRRGVARVPQKRARRRPSRDEKTALSDLAGPDRPSS
jgi:hypothetical protein